MPGVRSGSKRFAAQRVALEQSLVPHAVGEESHSAFACGNSRDSFGRIASDRWRGPSTVEADVSASSTIACRLASECIHNNFLFTIEYKSNSWTLRLFATPHARSFTNELKTNGSTHHHTKTHRIGWLAPPQYYAARSSKACWCWRHAHVARRPPSLTTYVLQAVTRSET